MKILRKNCLYMVAAWTLKEPALTQVPAASVTKESLSASCSKLLENPGLTINQTSCFGEVIFSEGPDFLNLFFFLIHFF